MNIIIKISTSIKKLGCKKSGVSRNQLSYEQNKEKTACITSFNFGVPKLLQPNFLIEAFLYYRKVNPMVPLQQAYRNWLDNRADHPIIDSIA